MIANEIMGNIPRIKIIIGLGNPGIRYAQTYHNAGLLAIDWIARERDAEFKISRSTFDAAKTDAFILIKPKVFMNESGRAVSEALKYFGIKPKDLLLIHDDSDIRLGGEKLVFGRNSAGHNGVESVIAALKTKYFWRFRVGARKGAGRAGDFVLQKITRSDKEVIYSVFSKLIVKLNENAKPREDRG